MKLKSWDPGNNPKKYKNLLKCKTKEHFLTENSLFSQKIFKT